MGGGGVACLVHVVLDWMVFQWASMAEDPMEVEGSVADLPR